MISDEYAAGLFDGEGCISIGKHISKYKRPNKTYKYLRYYLACIVSMATKGALPELEDRYGGKLKRVVRSDGAKYWKWTIYSQEAELFLKSVLPHLHNKHHEAELALEFRKTFIYRGGKEKVPEAVMQKRADLMQAVSDAKFKQELVH